MSRAPVRTLPKGEGTPAQAALPQQLTTFVGREGELSDLESLIGSARLLTLTGAGGSGKTRLAHALAGRLIERGTTPVVWVELASLGQPELLGAEVAAAMGLRQMGAQASAELVQQAVGGDPRLIVLDNCEHIVDAVAGFVDALLRACPNVRVLATSREVLGVSGERAWLVPPLGVPAPGEALASRLGEFAAVRLFVDRARSANPSFALTPSNAPVVAAVCRAVNGLPLAIELAAARSNVLTPEQILERLTDAFRLLTSASRTAIPRHRTLRATVDWSYDLLSDAERTLVRRLSVFAGGFTLDAAESVCAGGAIAASEILDLLAGLVSRSLVLVQERGAVSRYGLLELIRQYARERLETDPDDATAVRRRHAEYCIELSNRGLPPELRHYGPPEWFAIVAPELDNFRAALDWALHHDPYVALRAAGAFFWTWGHSGTWAEGIRWCRAALAATPDEPRPDRAFALRTLAGLLFLVHDLDEAAAVQKQATEMWRRLDGREFARDASVLAYVLTDRGELDEALVSAGEGMAAARVAGDDHGLAFALQAAAHAHYARGEAGSAEELYRELDGLLGSLEFGEATAFEVHISRGAHALARGDIAAAADHTRRLLELVSRNPRTWFSCRALIAAVPVLLARGDAEAAARVLLAGVEVRTANDILLRIGEDEHETALLAKLREALDPLAFAALREQAKAMSLIETVAYAQQRLDASGTAAPEAPGAPSCPPARFGPPADAALVVRALGPLEIWLDGRPLAAEAWSYGKPRELLLYLLCHPDGRSRDQIGTAFWPESSQTQVRNSFKVMLHHLRRTLGDPERVVLEGERLRLNPRLDCWFDARELEQTIPTVLRERKAGQPIVEDRLRDALALYRGDFLDGEAVGDWHLEIHDRLRRLCIDGLALLGDLLLEHGDAEGAVPVFERLIRFDDLREDAHRSLMRCYALAGQRARALRQYGLLATLLAEELDAEPELETTRLFESIRQAARAT